MSIRIPNIFSKKEHKPNDKRLHFGLNKNSQKDKPVIIKTIDINNPSQLIKSKEQSIYKRKKIYKYATITVVILAIFTILFSVKTKPTVLKTGVRRILTGLGIYTEVIKSIDIDASDESWHIEKTAKWIDTNKAQITMKVNSEAKVGTRNKDIILVLDTSDSMEGSKIDKLKEVTKDLLSLVLDNNENNVAIITYGTSSTIVSSFSNDKETLLTKVDAITTSGETNYYAALQNVDTVMNGYKNQTNRDVITLFVTDGYPSKDNPNQVGIYEILKRKYPYMTINGVQYDMGTTVINELKQITDSQWIANQSNIKSVIFASAVMPVIFEEFVVSEYVENDYYMIDSINDIKVSTGIVSIEDELGTPKITWNLGNSYYMTGEDAQITIKLTLKENYVGEDGFYPTNKRTNIHYKLPSESEKTVNNSNPLVLKNAYEIKYDTNAPTGCTVPSVSNETHPVNGSVMKKSDVLSCNGYLFKGWELDSQDQTDIKKVNDDLFFMPEHDVTMRATWTKHNLYFYTVGKVHQKITLYRVLQNESSGSYAKEYYDTHHDTMDYSHENIYYYHSEDETKKQDIPNRNNVIFAGHCWQMIRTTDTGGVRMIYNGEAINDQCLPTRSSHVGYSGRTVKNLSSNYYYGTSYTYDTSEFDPTEKVYNLSGTVEQATWNNDTYSGLIGKYFCEEHTRDECSKVYLVDGYKDSSNAYVLTFNNTQNYSEIGRLPFNIKENTIGDEHASPSYTGYKYGDVYDYGDYEAKQTTDFTVNRTINKTLYFGSTITKKGNTYTINNPSSITPSEWKTAYLTDPNNLNSFKEKYTCPNGTTSCSVPDKVMLIKSDGYNGISYSEILLGKGRNGQTLTDTLLTNTNDWITNYNSYGEYKYACISGNNQTCSPVYFVAISNLTSTGFDLAANLYYGSDVTWDGTNYTLQNVIDASEMENISTHRYVCINVGQQSCDTVAYIVKYDDLTDIEYVLLKNGETTADISGMFSKNTNDSLVKKAIESWYKKNLLDYDQYIEDTIYCNDRSRLPIVGWNNDFSTIPGSDSNTILNCSKETDSFSVSNNQAKLKYKVGLMTIAEANLLNNSYALKTGSSYWLMSPKNEYDYSGYYNLMEIDYNGNISSSAVNYALGIRPVISLISGIEPFAGDGSQSNPYLLDLES